MKIRQTLLATLTALAVVAGLLFGYKHWRLTALGAADGAKDTAVVTIAALPMQLQAWQPFLRASGNVTAVQQVRLAAPSSGVVRKIAFASGSRVNAGDVLVKLDDEESKARLNIAEAEAALTRIKLQRARDLITRDAISKAQLQETEALAKRSAAEVDGARSVHGKKTIRAPFAGYVSLRDINLGQYLAEGESIVDLQSLDPVYVDFSMPQDRAGHLQVGRMVTVLVGEADTMHRDGKITAVNPNVDTVSRNLRARATLPNVDHALRPGMFVQVLVGEGEPSAVLSVPSTALRRSAFSTSVFVISAGEGPKGEERLIAHERLVRLGPAQDDRFVVYSGLKAGETIAVAGTFKLRDGAWVHIDNAVLPPGVAPSIADRPSPNP